MPPGPFVLRIIVGAGAGMSYSVIDALVILFGMLVDLNGVHIGCAQIFEISNFNDVIG